MSEPIAASGRVHWIGTGLSTGSGLRVLADRTDSLTLWGRTADKAARLLARLGVDGASARGYDPARLSDALRPGDVVVSMLPATEHATVLRRCTEAHAHFACSSYVSADILAGAPAAARAGTAVLTEAGLDPGIDHLMAHVLVARARDAVGERDVIASFTSYCGGVPAVPNPFRYRFSWAPAGVLHALRAPARYIEDGAEKTVERPWEATRRQPVGDEVFEVYPNRDSLPFVAQYGIPTGWRLDTFVRGTLRLDGWRAAWTAVFDELRRGDDERIEALARDLAARYPTTDEDRDRVVLAVTLSVRANDRPSWHGEYLLDLVGDRAESAMARCVSLPLAFGVLQILAGACPAGLRRAAEEAAEAERWLDFLGEQGIPIAFRDSPAGSVAAAEAG